MTMGRENRVIALLNDGVLRSCFPSVIAIIALGMTSVLWSSMTSQKALADSGVAVSGVVAGGQQSRSSSGTPTPSRREGDRASLSLSEAYCVAIAEPARDARYRLQLRKLSEQEAAIKEQLTELMVASSELEAWLERRKAFQKRATDAIQLIYSNMRADAAAEQISLLDIETATSVVMQLDARTASDILSEMDAKKAARITATLARARGVTELGDGS